MFKTSRNKRKPDIIMLLTVFVCLGVVLTTTVNAAEPVEKGWGIQLGAENSCQQAESQWLTCGNWQPGVRDFHRMEALAPQRASLGVTSGYLPDTGLVAYYSLADSQLINREEEELRFIRKEDYTNGYDIRQFGMALKQRYGSFGLSLGFEANRVDNLTDDPLIYFGVSNRW